VSGCPTPRPGKETQYPNLGGWLGPRAIVDGCGISRPSQNSIPDRPAHSDSLYRLSCPVYIYVCMCLYIQHLILCLPAAFSCQAKGIFLDANRFVLHIYVSTKWTPRLSEEKSKFPNIYMCIYIYGQKLVLLFALGINVNMQNQTVGVMKNPFRLTWKCSGLAQNQVLNFNAALS